MTANNECEICIQKYTPILRVKITCPKNECQYSVCKQCIKEYIKSVPGKKPHCMSCKEEWEDSFVIEILNKTFLRGDLKSQENKLIIEQEHAKMPETMNAVEVYLDNIEKDKKIKFLTDDMYKQHSELHLKYELYKHYKINDDLVEYLKKIDKDNELTEFIVKPIINFHLSSSYAILTTSLNDKSEKQLNKSEKQLNKSEKQVLNIIKLLDLQSKDINMNKLLNNKFTTNPKINKIRIKEITDINLIKILLKHRCYKIDNSNNESFINFKFIDNYNEVNKIFIIFNKKLATSRVDPLYFRMIHQKIFVKTISELLKDSLVIFTTIGYYFLRNHSTMVSSNPDIKLTGKELIEEYRKEHNLIRDSFRLNMQILQNKPFEKKMRKQFIMKCPGDDCRGFLSTKYKCDICKINVCPKCRAIKTEGHECKKEDIESTELIKKETKGCPQCGIPIFKISGCDQMWCVECKVAFSWRTGLIETGTIHNPHYYDWIKNLGNAVRNPGDLVCGGLIDFNNLNNHLRKFNGISECNNCLKKNKLVPLKKKTPCSNCNLNPELSKKFYEEIGICPLLFEIHRGLGDLTPILNRYRQIVQENNNNQQLRVLFLTKQLTKDKFEKQVLNKYNKRKKILSYLHVLELYNTVGIEQFTNLFNTPINDICIKTLKELLNTFNQLRIYTNDLLVKNSKGFTGIRVNINKDFLFEKVK